MSLKTIGIGAGEESRKVFASVLESGVSCRINVYTGHGKNNLPSSPEITIEECSDPGSALVNDLASGRIDAAIRGTLPANHTLSSLKKAFGVDHLERAALLETPGGRRFFLAPVGVDEGWTVGEKVALAGKARILAEKFGLPAKTGILSGGRLGDAGRHPEVDRSLAEAELVARLTGGVHYEILIEDAVRDCGVIIAPDGISGNFIFRTLTFLGSGHGHGAPVLNLSKIFIDTSRATSNYANAIRLAECLLK
ncbi:MAG: methanogenesis marker protein Mmp4/MtxX [Methanoregulaceae archaeon]|nr:methanogenesis marker protein Mmp4/MtxX [Methanoregulaceae archaeon]